MFRPIVSFAAVALISATLWAGDSLRNGDIVKLVQAGFEPATIIQKIRSSETAFDLSTDALIALKNSGVDETIVREMIRRQEVPPAPPAPAVPPVPAAPDAVTPAPSVDVVTATPATPPRAPLPPAAPMTPKRPRSEKFDARLTTSGHDTCKAKLELDRGGIRTSGCRPEDLRLRWDAVQKICFSDREPNRLTISTAAKDYKLETSSEEGMRPVIDSIAYFSPKTKRDDCR